MMRYLFYNGPMQTTSPAAKVATGTGTKTMLQALLSVPARIVGWGYSFDGSAAATPGVVELISTAAIAATVTAFVDQDITRLDHPGDAVAPSTAGFTYTTAGSGYSASVEGSIAAVRNLDGPQLVAPTNQIIYQAPLGFEAMVPANVVARIRMTFGASVNALCWMILDI